MLLPISLFVYQPLGHETNDFDPTIPEFWAQEALIALEDTLVAANLVHRDYEDMIASEGDTVNCTKPASFVASRKIRGSAVNTSDATTVKVPVILNQHWHTSFLVEDRDFSLSMQNLIDLHVRPAAVSIATKIDASTLAFAASKLLGNNVGLLGGVSSSTIKSYLIATNKELNTQRVPLDGRNLFVTPNTQAAMLETELFTNVSAAGDMGMALRNAYINKLYNLNIFQSTLVPYVEATTTAATVSGTITSAAAAGTTGSQACTVSNYEAVVGEFVTVAGDMQPNVITARTASTHTTAVTLASANKRATLSSAVLKVYKAVAAAASYANAYEGTINVTVGSGAHLSVGQLIAHGTGASRKTYTIIRVEVVDATTDKLTLDRPLDAAISSSDAMFPGPIGEYNIAMHRNAIALVTRPPAMPIQGTGARGFVANFNGLSIRAVISYDSTYMKQRVTLDMLAGLALLEEELGCLMFG